MDNGDYIAELDGVPTFEIGNKVQISTGTKGEFELTASVQLLDDEGEYIDSIYDAEGEDAVQECIRWIDANGYKLIEENEPVPFTWQRRGGYECSSRGDVRFSAFNAMMPDGRTIEEWYQCDIKGYCIGGRNWRLGKGKPPVFPYPGDHLWQMYLSLWRIWAIHNGDLILELNNKAAEHSNVLSDCFASTEINQARALATILNEWVLPNVSD